MAIAGIISSAVSAALVLPYVNSIDFLADTYAPASVTPSRRVWKRWWIYPFSSLSFYSAFACWLFTPLNSLFSPLAFFFFIFPDGFANWKLFQRNDSSFKVPPTPFCSSFLINDRGFPFFSWCSKRHYVTTKHTNKKKIERGGGTEGKKKLADYPALPSRNKRLLVRSCLFRNRLVMNNGPIYGIAPKLVG